MLPRGGKVPMIVVRKPEDIYQTKGEIQNGTFHEGWGICLHSLCLECSTKIGAVPRAGGRNIVKGIVLEGALACLTVNLE